MSTEAPPTPPTADWQSRATTAEAQLADLESKLADAEKQLAAARSATDAAERRRQIDREIAQSEAIDHETAALLTEAAVASMPEPDVRRAVRELRSRKPFLFRTHKPSAQSPAPRESPATATLKQAADDARTTGDRGLLLRYLRLRRAG